MNLGQKTGAAGAGTSALGRIDEALGDEELGEQVSPLVVDAVGQALQDHFRAIANMPLPDRLLVLLAELEATESSK
jgi:hypothetical protein